MKFFFTLIFLLIVGKANTSCGSTSFKIINGELASVWPWMVSLQYFGIDQNYHFCGGSIISDQYVVTAAHCVFSNSSFLIKAGTNTLLDEQNQNVYEVSKIYYNNYFWIFNQNDIALIKLKKKITFTSKIYPICLPNSTHENLVLDKKLVVLGWQA